MEIKQKLLDDAVDYSIKAITTICEEIGPRESGSPEERACQDYFMQDAKDGGWADEYGVEEFPVASRAFMLFTWVDAICLALAWSLFYVSPIISIVLGVVALVALLGEFGLYKQLLDPICKKTTSANLWAVRKPTGEVKRRIIIDGHPDSAYEWTMFYHWGNFGLIIGPVLSIISLLVTVAFAIYFLATGNLTLIGTTNELWWMPLLLWVFTPGIILLTKFSDYSTVVPGANDNLTGCTAAMGVLKYLHDADIRFEHTEVVGMLGGSEEAGLRGAKYWVKKHKKEIDESGIETAFIAVDTLTELEHMSIYIRDLSGTVKNSEKVCRLLDKGAEKSSKIEKPLAWASVYLGASDAAAITQGGVEAATLAAMNPNPPKYYHTRRDTPEYLSRECLDAGYDLLLQAIEEFDQNGLQ